MLSKHKSHVILILLFLILFSALAWATSDEEEDDDPVGIKSLMIKKRINAAYIMFGAGHLHATNLNSFLDTNQMPQVSQSFFVLGAGGHVVQKRIVIGLELGRYLEHYRPSSMAYNTSLSAKFTLINIGYLFQNDKGLMYYPMLGVGLGFLKLRVVENNIDSFDDLKNGQEASEATRVNILCNLGVSLDYFYKYNKKKKGRNSPFIGLRAGYIFSPFSSDWKVNRIRVPMGPGTTMQGPYIKLVIGLGGWIETLIKQAI